MTPQCDIRRFRHAYRLCTAWAWAISRSASPRRRSQDDAVFVFDEPTIGLHPLDVQVLLSVFDGLVAKGATVVVIEHDLDLIRNADYVIDMGPGGGDAGGQIVCAGTPGDIAACSASITGRYL